MFRRLVERGLLQRAPESGGGVGGEYKGCSGESPFTLTWFHPEADIFLSYASPSNAPDKAES